MNYILKIILISFIIPTCGYTQTISYSPISIDETITGCNDSIIVPITVYNTGIAPLVSSIEIETEFTGTASYIFEGFEDTTLVSWNDQAISDYRGFINVPPASGNYALAMLGSTTYGLQRSFLPDTINYFSIKLKSDDINGSNNTCKLGNIIYPNGIVYINHVNNNQYNITGSTTFTYTVINSWTHIELRNINYGTKSFDLYIDGILQQLSMGFNNSQTTIMSEIKLANGEYVYQGFYDDIQIGKPLSPQWLVSDVTNSVNIPVGDSLVFDITLYSDGLTTGTYNSEIIFNSNDPLSTSDTIPISLTVAGSPIIELSDSCLNLGPIMENITSVNSFMIYNTGCDTLIINGINTTLPEYSIGAFNTFILPNDSTEVIITFSPTAVGNYDSFITISNNDVDTVICLTAVSTGAPIITTSLINITDTITSCNDSIIVPLMIYNSGLIDLNATIQTSIEIIETPYLFFDGFEDGTLNKWTPIGGVTTLNVINTNPATGNNCLEVTGLTSSGISCDFTPDTVKYFSIKMKSDNSSGLNNYCHIGSQAINSIATIYHSYPNLYKVDLGNLVSHTYTVVNEWTLFEFKNIDYDIEEFDLYIDGLLVFENAPFNGTSVGNMSSLRLFNSSNNSSSISYYDDIQIGTNTTPEWVISSIDTADVLVGDSTLVNVTLYSDGLNTGTYNSNLIIESNDPITNELTIPVSLTLVGNPIIEFSDTCLNFGSIMELTNTNQSLTIYNIGCDTLFISSINPNIPEYTILSSSDTILPNDSTQLSVLFSPNFLGNYDSFITILNSNIDTTICLTGTAFGAPIISYDPLFINETITGCNDSVIVPVTIYNTGLSDLNTTITTYIENELDESQEYFFDGFESGDFDNWDIGVINTNTYGITTTNPASGDYCLSITGFYNHGLSYTFTPDTISYFSIKLRSNDLSGSNNQCRIGNYGNPSGIARIYHSGSNSYVVNNNNNNNTYTVSHTWTHFEFKNINYITKTFDLFIDGTLQQADMQFASSNMTNMSRIGLLNFDDSSIGYYDDIQIGKPITPEWISSSLDSINIPMNDSIIIDVTLYSDSLNTGTFYSSFVLNSNDPLNYFDSIPVTLSIIGAPIMGVSETCVNFPSIMENTIAIDTLTLYNLGCDTLFIANVLANTSEYTVNNVSTYILPDDSLKVEIIFTPTFVGNFNSSITIFNNNIDTTICLTGTATGSPSLVLNPNSMVFSIDACQNLNSIDTSLTIYNQGLSDLEWSLIFGTHLFDGFNTSTNPDMWSSIGAGGPSNNCGAIGAKALYFNNSSMRHATTVDMNTLGGGEIQFYLKFGTGVYPCDFADAGEDVVLEYSTNFGSTWTILNTYETVNFSGFNYVLETIPSTAQTSNTRFRWRQISHSGAGQDHWTIDEVDILHAVNNSTPILGTTIIDDSITIPISFYTSGLTGGTHSSPLFLITNDPLNSTFEVNTSIVVSGDPCADFSYNVLGGCSGYVSFSDSTFNNPTTWLWDFGDGTSSTNQHPLHSYVNNGNYVVELIACNSTSCDTIENIVTVTSNGGPQPTSCLPDSNTNLTTTGISNVQLNTISNTSTMDFYGYQDFTCSVSTTLEYGVNYNMIVNTSGTTSTGRLDVWLDMNNDGTFDSSEILASINSSDSDFIIPINISSIVEYNVPLRLRIGYDMYSGYNNPCYGVSNGELEDYTVTVIPNTTPPNADFSHIFSSGCTGQIQLTDLTTNSPTSWFWDFGDGSTSTSQNPVHTYSNYGTYLITLQASNANGSTFDSYTYVYNGPIDVEIETLSPLLDNEPILFNPIAPGAVTWSWNFGDGGTSYDQSPTHTYTAPGQYIVTLYVSTEDNCYSGNSDTINISSLGVEEINLDFTVYPNPNKGSMYLINLTPFEIDIITITSALGGQVFNYVNENNTKIDKKPIDITEVENGIYFITVIFHNGTKSVQTVIIN